jgi:hypothetical protein
MAINAEPIFRRIRAFRSRRWCRNCALFASVGCPSSRFRSCRALYRFSSNPGPVMVVRCLLALVATTGQRPCPSRCGPSVLPRSHHRAYAQAWTSARLRIRAGAHTHFTPWERSASEGIHRRDRAEDIAKAAAGNSSVDARSTTRQPVILPLVAMRERAYNEMVNVLAQVEKFSEACALIVPVAP